MARRIRLTLALVASLAVASLLMSPPVAATPATGDFLLTLSGGSGPTGSGIVLNDVPVPLQPGVNGAFVSFSLGGLQPGATYRWTVRSGDTCGSTPGTLLFQAPGQLVADAAGEIGVATYITPPVPYSSVGTSWIAVRVTRLVVINPPVGQPIHALIPVTCGNVGTGGGSSRHWW